MLTAEQIEQLTAARQKFSESITIDITSAAETAGTKLIVPLTYDSESVSALPTLIAASADA